MRPPDRPFRLAGPRAARHEVIVAIVLAAVAIASRAQTFGNPVIGFDEQFYLVVGDRMLQGAVPFVDIFDRKPIGLFLIFAFTRLLGGEGTLQYQLAATLCAWATAVAIWRLARQTASPRGALAAGIAYLLWLDFMEGEGGQAPVWFNLPMVGGALLVDRLLARGKAGIAAGAMPMLLVGIAIQIKYTALFEGIFFGVALLWTRWTDRAEILHLAKAAPLWVLAALAPTSIAYGWYLADGFEREFLFANFLSMWGKLGDPLDTDIFGLLTIAGVLLPLLILILLAPESTGSAEQSRRRFVLWWLGSALAGMVAMGSFSTPQYALPVLLPAVIAAAPALGSTWFRNGRLWIALAAAFLIGQVVLVKLQNLKGRAVEAALITRAARPQHGCLFVYDGYPALYRLTGSCTLSRFVFPGHLNMTNEGSKAALGVDPAAEVRRIMALGPETVTMDDPPFERVNQVTYQIMRDELARHYRLSFAMRTGDRQRLVYRRK